MLKWSKNNWESDGHLINVPICMTKIRNYFWKNNFRRKWLNLKVLKKEKIIDFDILKVNNYKSCINGLFSNKAIKSSMTANPVYKLFQSNLPPNTAPLFTASPNTAAHFNVPNRGFLGYINWLLSQPVSEYHCVFISPEISGIGRGDCTSISI